VAGPSGMAGSAIAGLACQGNGHVLDGRAPQRSLTCFDPPVAVQAWFAANTPRCGGELAGGEGGGDSGQQHLPRAFLLENLKIQNHVIENAWAPWAAAVWLSRQQLHLTAEIRPQPITEGIAAHRANLEPTNALVCDSPRSPHPNSAGALRSSTALTIT